MERSVFSIICEFYIEEIARNPARKESVILKKVWLRSHREIGFSKDKDFVLKYIFSKFENGAHPKML